MTAKIRTAKCSQMCTVDVHWDRLVGIPRDASMRLAESWSRCRHGDTANSAFIPADTRIASNYKTPARSRAHGEPCQGTLNTVPGFSDQRRSGRDTSLPG